MSAPIFLVCLVAVIAFGFIAGRSKRVRDKRTDEENETK